MSTSVSCNFHLASSSSSSSPSTTSDLHRKQGIVSILGSDCDSGKSCPAASLRRTLSADMSSKKWLAQNGFINSFSPMKKIASSDELASATNHGILLEYDQEDEDDELERPGQDEVWRSIQLQKKSDDDGGNKWSWGSILFDKDKPSNKLPPPYIPPLVRRSGSSLSEKSLEICTESLGSETGSDGFSSYPASEVGDAEEEKETEQQPNHHQQLWESYEDFPVVKYSAYSTSGKKTGPRSFPPPLPSLAREDGASVHMESHRRNGRLVLEAVSVPSQNYFQAHREHGRLRLSLLNENRSSEDEIGEEFEEVFNNFERIEEDKDESSFFDDDDQSDEQPEEEEDEEEEEAYYSDVGNDQMNPSKLMHVQKIMVKKLLGLDKKNLSWSSRFNLLEEMAEEADDPNPNPLPQSLPPPPPPRVARLISTVQPSTVASSFNSYEYFWREKQPAATMAAAAASVIKPAATGHHDQPQSPAPAKYNQNNKQQMVLMRGGNKAEYLVPVWRRCNDSRRSLLLWEPYCIAT